MSEINSPIGRTFTASSKAPRTYVVDDASDSDYPVNEVPQADLREQFATARAEKKSGSRISPGGKQRIEILTGIGRLSKDVTVADTSFSLRTLKHGEFRDALIAASNESGIKGVFEARKQQLARSITKINGYDMEQVLGSNDLEARLDMLEELDETLITILYDEYASLTQEANAKFSIKKPEEIQEIVEDLKK